MPAEGQKGVIPLSHSLEGVEKGGSRSKKSAADLVLILEMVVEGVPADMAAGCKFSHRNLFKSLFVQKRLHPLGNHVFGELCGGHIPGPSCNRIADIPSTTFGKALQESGFWKWGIRMWNFIGLLLAVGQAFCAEKLASLSKIPAVLGALLAEMALGPKALGLLSQDMLDAPVYEEVVSFMESCEGLMLGSEMGLEKDPLLRETDPGHHLRPVSVHLRAGQPGLLGHIPFHGNPSISGSDFRRRGHGHRSGSRPLHSLGVQDGWPGHPHAASPFS